MSDVTVTRIDEVEPYRGPHQLAGIDYKALGKALGVSAWGMNVLELAPGATTYPEHDHEADRQEEVYLVLEGQATLRAGDEVWQLGPGMAVRVGPGVRRAWHPGEGGVTLLALGATPGKAYEPRA